MNQRGNRRERTFLGDADDALYIALLAESNSTVECPRHSTRGTPDRISALQLALSAYTPGVGKNAPIFERDLNSRDLAGAGRMISIGASCARSRYNSDYHLTPKRYAGGLIAAWGNLSLNRVSPQIRSLAEQLKASETPTNTSAEVDIPAAFRAIDKLRPHLSMLMGRSGFQALLARALVLATAEVPWLTAVRVVADGELEGLTVAQATFDAADFAEGEVVLLAQLLGLLVAFIGPALTLRLINQLWPQLSFNAADFSNTANNEEAR